VLDADRQLRLRVDRRLTVVVLGLLAEPFLRFDPTGVWVNRASPTTAVDLLATHGRGWKRVAPAGTFAWHDHRLAPPAGMAAGTTRPWSLPLLVDGRRLQLRGEFVRVRRPAVWLWLGVALAALGLLCAAARIRPRARTALAATLAGVAAAAALAATTGFTVGDPLSGGSQWFELACTAVLAVIAAALLRVRDRSARAWGATMVGVVAAVFGLSSLNVLWHGVIVSALPATVARLAIAVALVGGLAAAVAGVAADEREGLA